MLSASSDKTARVWALDSTSEEYAPRQTVKLHKGDVTGLFVHPIQSIFGLASLDRTYSIHDLTTFSPVFQSAPGEDAYSAASVHPDGILLGLGTPGSTIQIYDIRSGALAATLTPDAGTPFTVSTLSFSVISSSAPLCFGKEGSVVIEVSGGVEPYSYSVCVIFETNFISRSPV